MERHLAGEVESYSVHHSIPQTFGGDVGDALTPPLSLPLNSVLLHKPLTPGLPPATHPLLPPPAFYQLPFYIPREDDDEEGGLFALPPEMREAITAADASALPLGQRLDPLYPFILLLALGIGSSYINLGELARYTLLWALLLVLGTVMTLMDSPRTSGEMSSANLGWGLSFGLVFSLPLFILMQPVLASLVGVLFPDVAAPVLFQTLVLLTPLSETLFLRGALLERRGFSASLIGAALLTTVLYWPLVIGQPVYLAAAVIFNTVLAGLYGFVRTRYGLSAALICQVIVNLLLLFLPVLLA